MLFMPDTDTPTSSTRNASDLLVIPWLSQWSFITHNYPFGIAMGKIYM